MAPLKVDPELYSWGLEGMCPCLSSLSPNMHTPNLLGSTGCQQVIYCIPLFVQVALRMAINVPLFQLLQ